MADEWRSGGLVRTRDECARWPRYGDQIREQGGEPSSRQVDELLDERGLNSALFRRAAWMAEVARDSEGRERNVADRAQDSICGAVAADVVG
jgi:hypothetical protein